MQAVGASSVYHPRQPQKLPLWQLLNDHFHDFELNYDARCVRRYGYPVFSTPKIIRQHFKYNRKLLDAVEGRADRRPIVAYHYALASQFRIQRPSRVAACP